MKLIPACMLCSVLMAGCISAPKPPEVTLGPVSRTLMFPVVDMRDDRSIGISDCDPQHPVTNPKFFMPVLSELSFAVDHGLTSNVSRADFEKHNTDQLKQIPSAGHQYVALVFLEKFVQKPVTFEYRVTAYIVRPDTGAVVWSHTLEDSRWQGIVAGPLNMAVGLVGFRELGTTLTHCQALHRVAAGTFVNMPKLSAY